MEQPATNPELLAFQASLRLKLRYLGSFFSIVFIIVGLYLLLSGLLTLVGSNGQTSDPAEITTTAVQTPNETEVYQTLTPTASVVSVTPTVTPTGEPSIAVTGINTQRSMQTANEKSAATAEEISNSGKWQATDYASGDIPAGSYTVKLGDTLWEIAEAVYGSGDQWQVILKANSVNIGFLANGQQALIIPGQILTLPAK